ncbi:MAG: hypothetical protein HXX10_00995 [Rhodoplanes sp.]|uniref:hypothetical protein n=1 Tax=Rhodoplanes sp. TaxID=1968906 RepID=UPI00180CD875|nr:hypothetical protein [Rhodoplanes sp.]NVO12590.1 hypothetical protein [Rhodoplanes sp.]
MSTTERRASASASENRSRPAAAERGLIHRLLGLFAGAHYDTVAARKNPRPIQTWTPNGWC